MNVFFFFFLLVCVSSLCAFLSFFAFVFVGFLLFHLLEQPMQRNLLAWIAPTFSRQFNSFSTKSRRAQGIERFGLKTGSTSGFNLRAVLTLMLHPRFYDFGATHKILLENIAELRFEWLSSFKCWELRKEQMCKTKYWETYWKDPAGLSSQNQLNWDPSLWRNMNQRNIYQKNNNRHSTHRITKFHHQMHSKQCEPF